MELCIGYHIILSIISSFVITYTAIPSIIKVVELRNFYDTPDERKLHKRRIPTLGGAAIFAGMSIASIVWNRSGQLQELPYIIAGSIVIFFIGLKDDILIIAPLKKMGGQALAAIIVVVFGDIRLTNLHGLFHIYEIPFFLSIALSFLIIVSIINAYNFIDGLDGLASSLGMLSTTVYGLWFILHGNYSFSIISFSLLGALAAFLRFNVHSGKLKIFMGDTGSMLIGFLLSVSLIYFIEENEDVAQPYALISAPAIAFGVIIVPFFDMLRVMFIRVFITRSLSTADKNHIHHRLIRLGLTHIQSTLILVAINLGFIIFMVYFRRLGIIRLFLLSLIFAMVLSYLPTILMFRKLKRENQKKINT